MILDLDDVIEKPVPFKLLGVTRYIKPLKLSEFFGLANAFSKVQKTSGGTGAELARQYYEIFNSCVDPITIEDVLRMTQAQCAILLSVIIRRMSGESSESLSDTEDVKKKSLAAPVKL